MGTRSRHAYVLDDVAGVPPRVGPFSHAVQWGDLLFVTGQMPTDPVTGRLVGADVVEQTRQVLRNLEAVVGAFGARLSDALMVRAYLVDFADYDDFNAEYLRWFDEPLPSRTCVGCTGLAVDALVEVDLVVGLASGEVSR